MSKYEQDILNAIGLRGRISVNELADLLKVSDQTIRRIVKPMVARGELQKVHGAIVSTQSVIDPPFLARMNHNREEKIAIAGEVARLVNDGQSLAIDTGSTSGFIAQALRHHRDLTLVTNSAFVASTLAMIPGNKVFMAGTQLRSHDGAAFDRAAFDVIASLQVDYAILSASTIHPQRGFLVQEQCEVDITKAMMSIADQRVMAVDHSKFSERKAALALPNLQEGDYLIVDQAPDIRFDDLISHLTIKIASN
ncbi:DeoR/GlpR family DNA-binding transcription regulator [Pelagibius sp. Alg239-R121]|uniref:DeoR/GlpR family DNA-binding transcription regulator n=1 Tax=Pelagibius sp. Alg239-R121 TaxID=2993448 RepID=UPI0024A6DDA0|nr:DeoR/GlpR family DNA-binding transcription regulator [Pelagibius sp. Alg239-R121]